MRLENGEGASLESLLRVARALGVLDSLLGAIDPYATDVGRLRSGGTAQAGALADAGAKAVSGDIAVYVTAGEQKLRAGQMYSHRRRGVESTSFVYDSRFLTSPHASCRSLLCDRERPVTCAR